MLTIIGLGLGGPNSITMDGVISLSLSDHIFYETYTSPIHPETLEWVKLKSQKDPIHLSRSQVEEPTEIIDLAKEWQAFVGNLARNIFVGTQRPNI